MICILFQTAQSLWFYSYHDIIIEHLVFQYSILKNEKNYRENILIKKNKIMMQIKSIFILRNKFFFSLSFLLLELLIVSYSLIFKIHEIVSLLHWQWEFPKWCIEAALSCYIVTWNAEANDICMTIHASS